MSGDFAVKIFLSELKSALEQDCVVFVKRPKNTQFLLDRGLTEDDVFEMVEDLKVKHYKQGPLSDNDGSDGNLMVFHYPWEKLLIYIKIKLCKDEETGENGVILSFHEEGMHNV